MIDESKPALVDPLVAVRDELIKLYSSKRAHADTINTKVRDTIRYYGVVFGHLAEFWLLMAVGARLANPLPINGHVASTYYNKAYKHAKLDPDMQEDAYAAMQKHYMELLITQLEQRASRSPALTNHFEAGKYERAATHIKHRYNQSFHTRTTIP